MFKYVRLWAKIAILIGTAIVLACTTLTLVSLNNLESLSRTAERGEMRQFAAMIQTQLRDQARFAEGLSALVSNLPDIQAHFAAGDRAWLVEQLSAAFAALKRDYGAAQFQFLTPPAISFLRLHLLDKFGDDLSAIRKSVVDTNRDRVPHRGLEFGVGGLGARGVVPIAYQGRHLGAVEFGMSFGQAFLDAFKADFGVDAAFYVLRGGQVETVASTYGKRPFLGLEALQAALAGEAQLADVTLGGTEMSVYAEVVRDYSGTALGVIEIARDRGHYAAALAQTRNQSALVALLAALFGLGIALFTSRTITSRIALLSAGIERVSQGDLTGGTAVDGRDELADLARVVDAMRGHLSELVAGVEGNAVAVLAASREISRSVEGQAATSSQMSASVAEITSTMEELSVSSSQIAEYSQSVVAIASRTYDDSQHGAGAMQQLVAKMQRIGDDNQRALNEILDLGTRSKEISKIMEIIDTVADQTRLIAFNAALEASSAGEAGKRFGVVAAEIRRLADSVTESTGEIAVKIAEIQESINRLVISSEKGSAGIQQGMADSATTAGVLQALVEAASETSSSAQQISLSTQQQRTASNQVVVALREIVTASAETAQTVREIARVATQMNALSLDLTERVGRFKLAGPAAPAAATAV